MGAVSELAARALTACGFECVFRSPVSALFCAEPAVLTEGAFERAARLEDGRERGIVIVDVLICRDVSLDAEAAGLAAERALRAVAWPVDCDGFVRIAAADTRGAGPRGRDGSGRWLWGFELVCTVVRHVG
ncbi:hypothetical protein [Collinsella ihumii]|uniref:DUF3168 domain-containing protein n=1 Tax=Collinsella ihumii TaxID=1720204 RepID=A0AAW7JYS1_9ACTN|nr:hypothetical protein [Collinsella ihumii]MDN0068610.1 hypothetical protein [Collinsella ihumii]